MDLSFWSLVMQMQGFPDPILKALKFLGVKEFNRGSHRWDGSIGDSDNFYLSNKIDRAEWEGEGDLGDSVRQCGGALIHCSRRLENVVKTDPRDVFELLALFEKPRTTIPPNTFILGCTLIYPATLEEQLALLHEWDFGHDFHSDAATGLSEVGMNNPERVMQRRNAASRLITEMWNSSPLTLTQIRNTSLTLQFNEIPSRAQADMWAIRTWEHFRSNYMREDWYVEAMARDNSLANCKRLARKFGSFYLGPLV